MPAIRRLRAAAALTVALAAPAAPAAAAAQPFHQHYEQGLAHAERGEWSAALEQFAAAAELEPRPRARIRTYGNRYLFDYDPHFHQARCLIQLGRWAEAREQLAESRAGGVTPAAEIDALAQRAAAGERAGRESASGAGTEGAAPPATTREQPAGRRGDGTGETGRPTRLAVTTRPAGAEVVLDGRTIGRTPLAPLRVEAGGHRVRLTAEGFAPWEQTVEAAAGETLRLDVTLRPPAAEQPAGRDGETGVGDERQPAGRESRRGDAADAPAGTPPVSGEPGPAGAGVVAEAEEAVGAVPPPTADGTRSASRHPAAPGAAASGGLAGDGVDSAGAADGAREAVDTTDAAAAFAQPRVVRFAVAGALALAAILFAALLRRRRQSVRGDRGRIGSGALAGGDRIGGYRVLGELGRGGMAVTYRARRRSDGLEVALKVPRESPDPTYLDRFLREGKLGETLHHPGIVRIVEAAEDRGLPFLAMELIPGRTLRAELDAAPGGLPERRALEIARAIAEALDYAHGKSVVHRDLKPENIMLLPDGGLKVMDFGVARIDGQPGLTTSQIFFGSPIYAAPELVDPRTIDQRADLYSLGILLYEMLEGRPPFVHESVFKLLEMHQKSRLPDPAALPRPLSPALWAIVARLCEKRPERRYASAQQLLVDLDRLLYREADGRAPAGITARPESAAGRARARPPG